MNAHKILIFSSCLFLLPYLNIILFLEDTPLNIHEKHLSALFVCNFVLSVLFWHNPVKKSTIHKIDGVFAKISVISTFLYVAFLKNIDFFNKIVFYMFYLTFITLARLSNKISRINWCSNKHIFFHFLMHLCGIFGSYIAFL